MMTCSRRSEIGAQTNYRNHILRQALLRLLRDVIEYECGDLVGVAVRITTRVVLISRRGKRGCGRNRNDAGKKMELTARYCTVHVVLHNLSKRRLRPI